MFSECIHILQKTTSNRYAGLQPGVNKSLCVIAAFAYNYRKRHNTETQPSQGTKRRNNEQTIAKQTPPMGPLMHEHRRAAKDDPVSILHKSTAGRYRPVRVADGPIMARCRFIKNASWRTTLER